MKKGNKNTFTIMNIDNPIFVWIYQTDPNYPVKQIKLKPIGNDDTFTANFLKYVSPFQILRFTFWQGQVVYNPGAAV